MGSNSDPYYESLLGTYDYNPYNCGNCDKIVYAIPGSIFTTYICNTYSLVQGCNGNSECSGSVEIHGAKGLVVPSSAPSVIPSPTTAPSLAVEGPMLEFTQTMTMNIDTGCGAFRDIDSQTAVVRTVSIEASIPEQYLKFTSCVSSDPASTPASSSAAESRASEPEKQRALNIYASLAQTTARIPVLEFSDLNGLTPDTTTYQQRVLLHVSVSIWLCVWCVIFFYFLAFMTLLLLLATSNFITSLFSCIQNVII